MPLKDLLPNTLCALLWGDLDRWGLTPKLDDLCGQEWQSTYSDFYQSNQRQGIGTWVKMLDMQ